MAKKIEPMTSGAIWKHMTFFAMPLLLGNLFQQLYNTVDSLIVGNYLGSSALAAVSSSGSLIFMLIGLLSGISSGAGVLVSQFFGASDTKNLQRAVHTTVAFGMIAGLLMTAVGTVLSPQFLIWMGTPASVMSDATVYLRVYFAGSFGFVMYNIFVGILQAIGDSRHPLQYLILSSVINLILDILFIGVLHTGVGGAALATVISQAFSAGLCLVRLLKTRESYRLEVKRIGLDMEMLGMIIKIGLPAGIQNSIISFANVVVQSHINSFGEMAMAGCGAYGKIQGFAFLPINSFTMAMSTFISQNLGAKQMERVKKGARFGIRVTVILSELIGVFIFLFIPQMLRAFDSNPEVIQFGVREARIDALFYFLLAYSYCIASILRGSGRSLTPMIIMISFWCAVRVMFLSITVPMTRNIQMIYIIYPITWALSSIVFFVIYKKARWLNDK